MGRVFVVQSQPGKNLAPATKFGELVELLPPTDQIIVSAERAIQLIGDKLATFDNADFLLLIGDPIAILVAGVMAARINKGFVNALKWDRQAGLYYKVELDFEKYQINYNRKVNYDRDYRGSSSR